MEQYPHYGNVFLLHQVYGSKGGVNQIINIDTYAWPSKTVVFRIPSSWTVTV